MQEGQRVRDIHEPGHRYLPRAVQPRLVRDVVARRDASTDVTPVAPPTHPQHVPVQPQLQPPITQRSVAPLKPVQSPLVPKKTEAKTAAKPALPRQNRSLVLRRKMLDSAKRHKKSIRAERQRTAMAFVFGTIAASALFVGGFLIYVNDFRDSAPKQQATVNVATLGASTSAGAHETDETAVSVQQVAEYRVDANAPRALRIPKLGVESRVRAIEAGLNGEPAPTSSIFDTGWLKTSPLPGTKGVVIMNGAKVGPTKAGVFNSIDTLQVGDEIVVELGNGKLVKYEVVGSKQFEAGAVNMTVVSNPAIAGASGMNILTNTGRFNVKTNKFEPRTLIMTVLRS